MADLSNAEVGGGIVFEIKGDNSPLKLMLRETESALKTATSHKYELKIGIDPQMLQQLKSAFTSAMAEFRQVSTIKIKPELDQQAVEKVRQQVDHETKGHGNLAKKNILSLRGLEGLGIGGSATAAYGIFKVLEIAGKIAEAQSITGSRILNEMTQVGSAYHPAFSQRATAAANELAGIQRSDKITESVESIPIIGSLVQLGMAASGHTASVAERKLEASREIERDKFLYQEKIRHEISIADFTGDTAGAGALKRESETKGLEIEALTANRRARKKHEKEYFEGSTHWAPSYLQPDGSYAPTPPPGGIPSIAKTPEQIALEKRRDENQMMQARDDAVMAARMQGYGAVGGAATLRGEASATRAGAIGGTSQAVLKAQLASTLLEQKASEKEAIKSNNDALARLEENGKEQSKLADQLGQQAIERERKNAEAIKGIREQLAQDLLAINQRMHSNDAQIGQDLIANQAQGNQNRLLISRQFFEAKKQGLQDSYSGETHTAEDANAAEIRGLIGKHAGAGEIFSVLKRQAIAGFRRQGKFGMDQQLMDTQEDYRVTQSVLDSAASSQSSALKAGGFNWKAHVASRNREQYKALGQIENKQEWTAKLAEFRANNNMEESGHKFELQDRKIARDADFNAAVDRQKDLPISGQIEQAAATARLAIRNADPSEREDVRKTEMAKFKATEHELLGLHGGGYAAKGSAFFTPGDPLGLGKGAEDRANAQAKAKQGEAEITVQQGKDTATIATWLTQTFGPAIMAALPDMIQGLVH